MFFTYTTPADVEKVAASLGMTAIQLCKAAKIAPSTFNRWKSDATNPSRKAIDQLNDAAMVEKARQAAPAEALS